MADGFLFNCVVHCAGVQSHLGGDYEMRRVRGAGTAWKDKLCEKAYHREKKKRENKYNLLLKRNKSHLFPEYLLLLKKSESFHEAA